MIAWSVPAVDELKIAVEIAEPPAVKTIGFWLKEIVMGPITWSVSVMIAAKPFWLVTITLAVPVVPARRLTVVGLTEKEKS
jgi:hypothetical protein